MGLSRCKLLATACLALLPGLSGCATIGPSSQRLAEEPAVASYNTSADSEPPAESAAPSAATPKSDSQPAPLAALRPDAQQSGQLPQESALPQPPAVANSSKEPAAPKSVPPAASMPPAAEVDPRALQRMMTELHDLRSLDPAGHDQLLADLKHVDPKLWPLLVQGFKASVDYRQRKQAELLAAAGAAPPAAAAASTEPNGRPPASAETSQAQPELPATTPAVQTAVTSQSPVAPVQPAAHRQESPPTDWAQPLNATIGSLEAALIDSPPGAEDDRQVYLRLLYLLAGRRDKALEPMKGMEADAQEFWSYELYALSTYLDRQRISDTSRRAAEAAVQHWEASNRLSQQANLLVRNVAFCTEVLSYGIYTPFDRQEFQPGQPVVLYAEVENFISEPTPRGYHTALESRYEIYDSRGQKVDERQFPLMEEYCKNRRRDFFIAYEAITLPSHIYDGKYTLKLTIEDTLGKKVGQSALDFHIKRSKDAPASK